MLRRIPGFRSGRRWRSVIAVIGYIIIVISIISSISEHKVEDSLINFIELLIFIGIPYIVIFNLGSIKKLLPFFKHGKIALGYIFSLFIWVTIFIFSVVSLDGFHSQEFKADRQLRSEQRAREKAEKAAIRMNESVKKATQESTTDKTSTKSSSNINTPSSTSLPTSLPTSPNATVQPSSAEPTTTPAPMKEEPIKINFTGQISPNVAKTGEKVVIKIDVENTDETRNIEDIRLLFSSKKFIEDGLIVVNVMSGGQQDGNGFNWTNEGMKIPAKQKRSFQIVCQANKPGNYESIIQIKPVEGILPYSDSEGNDELNAKLTVIK